METGMIYIRFFNEPDYKKVPYNDMRYVKRVSYHLTICTANALFDKNIPDNHYVICPIYATHLDYQLGVTGHVKIGEDPYLALVREAGEEVGILLPSKITKARGDLKIDFPKYQEKKLHSEKNCWIFDIGTYPNSFVPKEFNNENIDVHKNDDKNKKGVGVIIHGNLDIITKYLSQDKIYTFRDTDNIIGVVAISIKKAREHVTYKRNKNKIKYINKYYGPKIIYY